MRRNLRRLSAGLILAVAATAAAAPTSVSAPLGQPPERVFMPSGSAQTAAIANDGLTVFNVGGTLAFYGPDAAGSSPSLVKEITGVGSAIVDLHPTHGIAVDDPTATEILVVDPDQAAGAVVPLRMIGGASTKLGSVRSVAWAPDGSLWVLDADVDGVPGTELLRFAPGASGDDAPLTTITGTNTRLSESLYGQATLAALPDGSAVVAGIGFDGRVLVFAPTATGNVVPTRRIEVPLESPLSVITGATADATGRIYASVGDFTGEKWGHVLVYAAGAKGAATPVYDVTGPTSKLQLPMAPDVAPNGRWTVTSALVLAGQQVLTRQMVFGPIPPNPAAPAATPSAPKALKVAKKAKNVVIRWKAPSKGPVGGYRVQVRKGKKVVASKTLTATRLKVKRSKLPAGKLKAVVVASNAAGSGPAATKTFRK